MKEIIECPKCHSRDIEQNLLFLKCNNCGIFELEDVRLVLDKIISPGELFTIEEKIKVGKSLGLK
ncbi:MAG: hypothetical protein ACTSQP_05335 [Promethearchaeota archaeon]